VTPDQPTPQTPLTLEYFPETASEDPDEGQPVIIAEPSFKYDGRVFVGVQPLGRRIGCHLAPADAKKLRDHLSKLLLEPVPPEAEEPHPDWQKRIEAAAQRAQKRQIRLRLPVKFRFEFELGSIQGVIGTVR
jgi:hypothetical protein